MDIHNMEDSRALVYYLGHSGYAVKTGSHFLIFDYFERTRDMESKSLSKGFIDPGEIMDKNVYVFVSHKHPDHFDKVIKGWRDVINNITYISGWYSTGSYFKGVPPHSSTTINDIHISTLRSTDEGSGFLVNAGGLTVFHAGDHANWEDNDPEVSYYEEIDYIANKCQGVDIAFIPVTTFSGARPKCMTEGALYALKKLKPKTAFPMHGNSREYLYKEFAAEEEAKAFNIICPEKPGDSFIVSY